MKLLMMWMEAVACTAAAAADIVPADIQRTWVPTTPEDTP